MQLLYLPDSNTMNKITFTAIYGDQARTIEINSPAGNGGGSFHIMEWKDKGWSYIGSVIKYNYVGWTVVSNYNESFDTSKKQREIDIKFNKYSFTSSDKVAILERMIEAGLIGPDELVNWG